MENAPKYKWFSGQCFLLDEDVVITDPFWTSSFIKANGILPTSYLFRPRKRRNKDLSRHSVERWTQARSLQVFVPAREAWTNSKRRLKISWHKIVQLKMSKNLREQPLSANVSDQSVNSVKALLPVKADHLSLTDCSLTLNSKLNLSISTQAYRPVFRGAKEAPQTQCKIIFLFVTIQLTSTSKLTQAQWLAIEKTQTSRRDMAIKSSWASPMSLSWDPLIDQSLLLPSRTRQSSKATVLEPRHQSNRESRDWGLVAKHREMPQGKESMSIPWAIWRRRSTSLKRRRRRRNQRRRKGQESSHERTVWQEVIRVASYRRNLVGTDRWLNVLLEIAKRDR